MEAGADSPLRARAGGSGRSRRSCCSRSSSPPSSPAATSLVDLIGRNPPAADAFDIGRVEFKPGEIRIRVRNPQPEELTIASVTVDDAIVPFTLDGPRR